MVKRPKATYLFNVTPIKTAMPFYIELARKNKTVQEFIKECKWPQIVKNINRERTLEGITIPDLKIHYITAAWYKHNKRHTSHLKLG